MKIEHALSMIADKLPILATSSVKAFAPYVPPAGTPEKGIIEDIFTKEYPFSNYVPPANTPTTPLIDFGKIAQSLNEAPLIKELHQFNESMQKIFNFFDGIIKIFSDPKLLWMNFYNLSYYIALFVAIAGFLYYIAGCKKGAKITSASIMSFLVLTGINITIR